MNILVGDCSRALCLRSWLLFRRVFPLLCAFISLVAPSLVFSENIAELHASNENVFSSSGHPKALGISISFKTPHGFDASEGRRPHIVQKFERSHGDLLASVQLIIENLEVGEVSRADAEDFFKGGEFLDLLVPSYLSVASSRATMIEGEPAAIFDTYGIVQRADTDGFLYSTNLVFIQRGALVLFQFTIGGIASQQPEVVALSDEYRPVWSSIMNSIIIENKWND